MVMLLKKNNTFSPGNGEVRVSRNMPKLKFGRKVGLVVLMKSDKVPMNPRTAFQVIAISRWLLALTL